MIILMTSLKIVKLSRVRWEGRHNNDNHDHDHEDNYDHDDDHDDHDHDLIRNGEVVEGEVGRRHCWFSFSSLW